MNDSGFVWTMEINPSSFVFEVQVAPPLLPCWLDGQTGTSHWGTQQVEIIDAENDNKVLIQGKYINILDKMLMRFEI